MTAQNLTKVDRRRLRRLNSRLAQFASTLVRKCLGVPSKHAHTVLKNIIGLAGSQNLSLLDMQTGINLVSGSELGGMLPTSWLTEGTPLDYEADLDSLDFILTYIGYAWMAYGAEDFLPNEKDTITERAENWLGRICENLQRIGGEAVGDPEDEESSDEDRQREEQERSDAPLAQLSSLRIQDTWDPMNDLDCSVWCPQVSRVAQTYMFSLPT